VQGIYPVYLKLSIPFIFFRKLCILICQQNAHYNKLHILIIIVSPMCFGALCGIFRENFFVCSKIIVTLCDYISVQICALKTFYFILFYMCILFVCSDRNLYPVYIWFFLITFFIPLNFMSRTIKFNSWLLSSRTKCIFSLQTEWVYNHAFRDQVKRPKIYCFDFSISLVEIRWLNYATPCIS
jgi:hypothetical protein